MYKDSKNRLEALRREHPELFQSRVFFVKVMQLLDTFTFKLTLRREVIALFSDVAKRKHPPLKATHKMIVGRANDEIGYIIPKRQWDEKKPFCYGLTKAQYGEINSCGPDVAAVLCGEFKKLASGGR